MQLSLWYPYNTLTHWGRETHICVSKLASIVSDWLVTWPAPSHYLNQCWNIVNGTLRNKLQWNPKRNSYIFIQEMHLKMSSGKWRPFCPGLNVLTHWVWDKMVSIWRKPFSLNNYLSSIKISLKKKSPADRKSALYQVMACLQTGHKLLLPQWRLNSFDWNFNAVFTYGLMSPLV